MPGFIAKKLCSNLVIVPLNFSRYTTISKQVRSVMAEYDPNYCPMSLDEAYLDLTEHLKKRQTYTDQQRTFEIRNVVDRDIGNVSVKDPKNIAEENKKERTHGSDLVLHDSVRKQTLISEVNDKSAVEKIMPCNKSEDISFDEELHCLIRNIPTDIAGTETTDSVRNRTVLPTCSKVVVPEMKKTVVFGLSVDEAVREMRFRIEQVTGLTASAGE
jgi:nucleotidyltransferase/DNA polymerase involved in DNA repair